MSNDYIKLDEFGEIDKITLSRETTRELEEKGYAMINEDILSGQYFVIKHEDGYYLTKAIAFNLMTFDY